MGSLKYEDRRLVMIGNLRNSGDTSSYAAQAFSPNSCGFNLTTNTSPKGILWRSSLGKLLFWGRSSRANEKKIMYTPWQFGNGWSVISNLCMSRDCQARGIFQKARRSGMWNKNESGPWLKVRCRAVCWESGTYYRDWWWRRWRRSASTKEGLNVGPHDGGEIIPVDAGRAWTEEPKEDCQLTYC